VAENRRACSSCGTPNEEDARFCEGCGGSLARVCATCGVEASATARFCRGCGAPLDERVTDKEIPGAGPVRKTVTVMFADLAGSTSFEEKVDVETAREVIGRYHDLLRAIAQRHRAGMTKYIGDGFMAVWGVPEVGPDDAAHAVGAAVALQEHFVDLADEVAGTHGVELALRVAVNTGEVVVGTGDADLVGDALNVGARLEAECPRGRVVVGEETWRATRGRYGYESRGEVQVKGRTAPVAVYQWLGHQSESADTAPFVGRGEEFCRLQSVLDDAVGSHEPRLVTVIGDPGVGKSRLAAEFIAVQGDIGVIDARCVIEASVALAPIIEVLRAYNLEADLPATISDRDRLLRALTGLVSGDAGSVEENFWALRRFVEVLAGEQPVVLVLDDIQWADTLLLDFIEHLMEWLRGVPVLVLALARPELRESRPDLVTVSRWVSEAVHLGGLDARATAELAAKVLGAARLPDELLRRLPSSTGGNPLFVRELIGMLAHDEVLVERPAGWRLTIDVDAIAIPPTIHALLASRLERLEPTDRRVLEIGSVIGSDFSPGTVRALAGSAALRVELSLNRLRRRELVQPSGSYVGDEPVWRFHHVLIRDVAYRRLLKSDRADLHERLADWVDSGGPSVAFDADEMIARHLEAAHTYRLELGAADEHTSGLALRSARHYAASARRALDRDELVSAGTQAARGAALAVADAGLHADLLLTGCEAFLSEGDVAAGAPLVDDLDRIADEALAPWAVCYRCQFTVYTDPARLPEVDALLQGAIDEFGRRRDHAGLAKAHRVRAGARARLGRIGDCETDLFEALIAARQSGDHRQITAALGAAPNAALWGPSPVPKAGGRCLDVVRMQRMTTAAPSLEATSLRCLAVLELLRGRPDKARTMLADARHVVADLGLRHGLMETELFAGIIESMEGDPVAAEPHFRTALDGFDALGLGADTGQAAALLAKSILAQGRLDEADEYAAQSERLAGRNLKSAIAWRAVRAEILAAQGRQHEAVAMAREAVEVAGGTDLVLDHADACLTLSRILDAAGDAKSANAARDNAKALYAAKEVTSAITHMNVPVMPVSTIKATSSSRLAVSNRATETGYALIEAVRARDIDAAAAIYSDRLIQDDRRRLSGGPIEGRAEARAALERLCEQYSHFESRMLAVRGEHLALSLNRWSDDAGNETTDLIVAEVDDEGKVVYQGRFDEDFAGAYREMDRRYYRGEGAALAESGAAGTEWTLALNRNDFDAMFEEFMTSDCCITNRSRSAFPDRSAAEYRTTLEELAAMVVSSRSWSPAVRWLSPTCFVARCEREGVGVDGEHYTWFFVIVFEFRDGKIASMCEFDPDDEDAAFAYAEERVRATTSRFAVSNRASRVADVAWRAMQRHDLDVVATFSTSSSFVYDDRRRFSGDSIENTAELQAASERILQHYPYSEWRTLAVRGERLELRWSHLWDDDGNEATTLNVLDIDENDQLAYFGRFEEDDFEGAYRELENHYYAGEGAAFAEGGAVAIASMAAINRGDFDRMFGAAGAQEPTFDNRSRSLFPNRSAVEVRAGFEELDAMVTSMRTWLSVVRWLSPGVAIARFEREAVGQDDEIYAWTRLNVTEIRNGRLASICQFELDDEEAAFAEAEERVRALMSRLAVTNQASAAGLALGAAMNTRNIDAAIAVYSERFVYDDHRRLSAYPIEGQAAARAALERACSQYTHWEPRVLAVRGERLALAANRRSDDEGNETVDLNLVEIDEDGLIIYQGPFDEDDFEGAYRELESRYYAGEGSAFEENASATTESICAVNTGDFDRLFELSWPDMRVVNRSRSAFPDRSVSELRASFGDLDAMVDSSRTWLSAVRWLSPNWAVSRLERQATGRESELYAWTRILVIEARDGRIASMCEFEVDDEVAAFAYAEERMRASSSRLAVANRASVKVDTALRALRAGDPDGMVAGFSDSFVYDDQRRLKGNPVHSVAEYRASAALFLEQYNRVEWRTLAVRGERLALIWSRVSNDDGFESTHLHLHEVDDDGRMLYEVRFDEDNFEGAYCELDRRYYVGEGAAFAEGGPTLTNYITALNRGDFDRAFVASAAPGAQIESRSRSVFGDRSVGELHMSVEQLSELIASQRTWHPVVHWLSPNWVLVRAEREAVGNDGERYAWTQVYVIEIRNARAVFLCEFELEDEEAAFDYAEERMRAAPRRLAVANRASQAADAAYSALRARDVEGMVANFSERCLFEDRRHLSGNPIDDIDGLRNNIQRLVTQYIRFESRTLAVRGERLVLVSSHISSEAGFETSHLFVCEVGDDGLISYQCTYDEEDFESAYRELESRYFAGEGAAFAEAGTTTTDFALAMGQGDPEELSDALSTPGLRVENRSRSAFGDRAAAEFRSSVEELNALVDSVRTYQSAVCWLSPTLFVGRFEREAVGCDGEQYTWAHLHVVEVGAGRLTAACLFDEDDEAGAFAYAEERMRAFDSRLKVSNLSSEVAHAVTAALRAGDADGAMGRCSERMVYDDHRRLSGDPIRSPSEFRSAFERIMQQYSYFERRILAVRGDTLNLNWTRWSDDAGYETSYLHVHEIGGDGRIIYEGRFDEDDFEGAYRVLSARYYSGEGAAFTEGGTVGTEFVMACHSGDFDRMLGELSAPGLRFESRSHSVIPDRSADELRASVEELSSMVPSSRTWNSVERWLSPNWCITRFEREAIGHDGEQYRWSWIYVSEIANGQMVSTCKFDLDDEEAAFNYATQRVQAEASRLTVRNRASRTAEALMKAMNAASAAAALDCVSDQFVYFDHRRLSGDPIRGKAELEATVARILQQYNRFETHILAVRGERLSLDRGRWFNDAGFETIQLSVNEVDDVGRIIYQIRFDEDDFEGAYRELDNRYYAEEGASFAGAGAVQTELASAINGGNLGRFRDLTAPDFAIVNRSRSIFGNRSAAEFWSSIEQLGAMVAGSRMWNSALCWLSPRICVARSERESDGQNGEHYAWTHISVTEVRDRELMSACLFEPEDEDVAFTYAEERVCATPSRLAVTNRATTTFRSQWEALRNRDVDAAVAHFAEPLVYDDRRRFRGNPLTDTRAGLERILEDYTSFEGRTLAVRGESLHLGQTRWSNEAGFEACYLTVQEVNDAGQIVYHARFDEDDLENAYRELDRRYYAGEGVASAEAGAAQTEWLVALNRGDLDRLFGELTAPETRFEMRSSSAFPDSSMAEARAAIGDFMSMMDSVRTWHSAVCWISPTCCVTRNEREAVGRDGEQYAWTRLSVVEYRDGRMTSECEFDPDHEAEAFAYAQERVRRAENR
jgi:class 3 adenylate cyclase/ketosteroid isomerase-like protein